MAASEIAIELKTTPRSVRTVMKTNVPTAVKKVDNTIEYFLPSLVSMSQAPKRLPGHLNVVQLALRSHNSGEHAHKAYPATVYMT